MQAVRMGQWVQVPGFLCLNGDSNCTCDYHIWFFHMNPQFVPVLPLSCSPSLLSNTLGHLRDKLLAIFHSKVGASGHSCPVIRDTGPSQRPDTALDMAGPAGHGKTAWLLSTQQRALYKKHGSATRNLLLWISSCVHYIRDWFSVAILSTKPLTVWKTPGCVAAAEHSHTDWEGNTAPFVQHRAAGLNISVWFRATKEKDLCLLPSSTGLRVIGPLSLSWLTTECIFYSKIRWLEKIIDIPH